MEHEVHHDVAEAFYLNPQFWVLAAFVVFVVLAAKAISKMIAGVLDGRSGKIKAELEEARRLREEAQAVLAQYKQKQAEYLKEAEALLTRAQMDADTLSAHAEKELRTALDERTKNAVEKIAQEEEKAIAEVRAHVVDIALATARSVIVEQVSATSQENLLALAIADIERKIH
jgi:F-type H+-transporting ATPase subunit b